MKKQQYTVPKTDLCELHLNDIILQGDYTIINLSNPSQSSYGEINTNDDSIWDDEENDLQKKNRLWDE